MGIPLSLVAAGVLVAAAACGGPESTEPQGSPPLGIVSREAGTGGGSGGDLTPSGGAAQAVPLDTVYYATTSGVVEPRREVIRSADAWNALWTQITSNLAPAPGPPSVDFSQQQLIVAALGERGTGGYDLEVAAAERAGGRLRVVVNEWVPGPTCMTTQALTQPVLVVAAPRAETEVEIVLRRVTRDCG